MTTKITNCLLMPHLRQRKSMFLVLDDCDRVEIDLDGYAIVPLDHYERLERLADIGAQHVAASAIDRARSSS